METLFLKCKADFSYEFEQFIEGFESGVNVKSEIKSKDV